MKSNIIPYTADIINKIIPLYTKQIEILRYHSICLPVLQKEVEKINYS
jgi:hypothetical protein